MHLKEREITMSNIKVVYWSGTGNTQAMAEAVANGIKSAGGSADLLQFSDVTADILASDDKFALGCPAMGAEQLEEGEVEPLFTELEGKLSGKKVALFGSYGWGSGEWMDAWVERVNAAGATVVNGNGVIANNAPDDAAVSECEALGSALAIA